MERKGLWAFFAALAATAAVILATTTPLGVAVAWIAVWLFAYGFLVMRFEVKKP